MMVPLELRWGQGGPAARGDDSGLRSSGWLSGEGGFAEVAAEGVGVGVGEGG